MVLVWHYFVLLIVAKPDTPLSYSLAAGRLSWSGVDLFFVLSGFLIGGILLDARDSPNYFTVFYARRVFRILPIYFAWVTAFLIFSGSWLIALQQFLFLQNLRAMPYTPASFIWLAATWSLAVEEQFYLLAPAIIRFLSRLMLYLFWSAVILMAPLF